MLIFDEINRKGFEGDLLLSGFAEFMRNLLVCKDEKAAVLLQVVEHFKPVFLKEAQSIDGSYLISALNVLSESEFHYKAARNKRLHIELALIKLAYLNQALHLNQGTTEKKKGTEAVKAVSFRLIAPLEIKAKKTNGFTEDISPEKISVEIAAGVTAGPKLMIDEPKQIPVSQVFAEQIPVSQTPVAVQKQAPPVVTSLGALSKIRQEVANRKNAAGAIEVKPLQADFLLEIWTRFSAELKLSRNPAAQSFEGAELRVLDDNRFEIYTNNNLEQHFIELEKRKLSDVLQQGFNNKNISFSVIIRDNPTHQIPTEKTVSKRDQFFQIVEAYPLVKELKDKLKLELDY